MYVLYFATHKQHSACLHFRTLFVCKNFAICRIIAGQRLDKRWQDSLDGHLIVSSSGELYLPRIALQQGITTKLKLLQRPSETKKIILKLREMILQLRSNLFKLFYLTIVNYITQFTGDCWNWNVLGNCSQSRPFYTVLCLTNATGGMPLGQTDWLFVL